MALKLDANIADPDGFYEALIKAHENLSSDDSAALNARLVFLLANQIGNQTVLEQCIAAARKPFNSRRA